MKPTKTQQEILDKMNDEIFVHWIDGLHPRAFLRDGKQTTVPVTTVLSMENKGFLAASLDRSRFYKVKTNDRKIKLSPTARRIIKVLRSDVYKVTECTIATTRFTLTPGREGIDPQIIKKLEENGLIRRMSTGNRYNFDIILTEFGKTCNIGEKDE